MWSDVEQVRQGSWVSRWWSWCGLALVVCLVAAGACSPPKEGCQSDAECQAPKPFCVASVCQSCRNDADCGSGQRCSQGACSAAQEPAGEPVAEPAVEPAKEPVIEPVVEPASPDEPASAPDDAGTSGKEDGPEPAPDASVTPETSQETPPEPKVVIPPTLPKASNICGNNKNCCVPTQVGPPIQEHTPIYTTRSLWGVAAWSKDQKWLAFASGDSTEVTLRKGTGPSNAYPVDKILREHTSGVLALAFSPDGKYLASAGYDRLVLVWQLSDGKRLYRLTGHGSTIYKMAFSADSSLLVTVGSYDRYIRIWKMADGKLQRAIRTPSVAWSVAISPDAKTIATGLDNSNVQLWNVSDGQSIKTMTDHTSRVRAVEFSPDGTKLISGSDDNRVRLWDVSTGKTIRTYTCGGDVYDVDYSPNGKTLAAACTDLTVRLWDANSTQENHRLTHDALASSVRWSADSKYVLSASYAKAFRIWDATTGRIVRRVFVDERVRTLVAYDSAGKSVAFADAGSQDILVAGLPGNKPLYTLKGHTAHITDLRVSPNGQYLVSSSADNTAKVWRLSDGKMVYDLKRHKQTVYTVAVDPTNTWIATGSRDNTLSLWQLSDGKWVREIKFTNHVRALAWSSDGRHIAVGVGNNVLVVRISDSTTIRTLSDATAAIESLAWTAKTNRLAAGSWDRRVYVWNALNWALINSWTGHSYAVTDIAFAPDGQDLATVSFDNTLRIWDPDTIERKHILLGHVGGITSVVYGPQKNSISTAAWDGTIRLWRLDDPSRVIQVGEKVFTISLSRDNLWVAAGMENGMVGVWRLTDGKKMGDFEAHEEIVRGVAFSPNGDILATASDDQTIKLWDMRGGKLLYTLKGHIDRVYKVRFNADGKVLASVSRDATVRLWDPATGKLIRKINDGQGALLDVTFSPDGKYLAAASFNGLVYVWQTSDYKLYASFRGHLGGALSVVFRNNNELLSGSLDSRIRYWRLSDQAALRNVAGHNGPVFDMAMRSDETYFGTASEDGTVRSWRASDGLLMNTGFGHKGPVNAIAQTHDGRWISGSSDGTIRIWNSLVQRVQEVKAPQPYGVTAVTLSRDGTLVISAADDRRTRLRNLSNAALLRTFYGATQTVRSVDISGDNATVAFGGDDTYVRVYAASDGAYIFAGKHDDSVTATMFSHDNKTIITGTEKGLLRVWDVATKKSIKDITEHQGKVHTLNRSADGKVWLSASTQGPIQLWQTSDGKKLQSWPKQSNDILSAALSAKADKVAAAIGSTTIKVWQVSDGKEIKSLTTAAAVLAVRFGGEGAWLAASLQNGTIVMWETQAYQQLAELHQSGLPLLGLHSLPNGSYISAGDASGMLYWWRCP